MDLSTLEKALKRERVSRKHAERLLEEKSRELFESFRQLESAHAELKQNQQKMVQSEKMASLGVLSAGVAHEINNPISFVASNLATLSEYTPVFYDAFGLLKGLVNKLDDDPRYENDYAAVKSFLEEREVDFLVEDTSELLDEMREGLARVKDIVSGLQNFARAEKATMEPVDLVACVRSTLALIKIDSKQECQLSDELDDVPKVMGSTGKLGQVFMNLIINGIQAISKQSELGRLTLRSGVQDGLVQIKVCDNGTGMSPKVAQKIFEPFFTTKGEGEGTGLGLSLSQGIVEEHGGTIQVDTELDVGTTFIVSLPVLAEPAAQS